MKVSQTVQVQILGAPRVYTYDWLFDPAAGERPLTVGDRVEIPPNQVQEEGSAATVTALGSDYYGPKKRIIRLIDIAERSGDMSDDIWAGFGEGDYS